MTASVTFRPATLADLPVIVALLADDDLGSGREDPGLPLDPRYIAAFETITADPNQESIVAELDGRIVGTMQLSYIPGIAFRGAWRGLIEAVRVSSELRGQGIGAQMILWANARFAARGCRMAQLSSHRTRTDAHRFYDRLGWDKSHYGFKYKLAD
ncbi:GNAT superfamily N-acetyltransferase [Sphingomonas sp. UYAg733]